MKLDTFIESFCDFVSYLNIQLYKNVYQQAIVHTLPSLYLSNAHVLTYYTKNKFSVRFTTNEFL